MCSLSAFENVFHSTIKRTPDVLGFSFHFILGFNIKTLEKSESRSNLDTTGGNLGTTLR